MNQTLNFHSVEKRDKIIQKLKEKKNPCYHNRALAILGT